MVCFCVFGCLFFFKQKTAYEMRISDWSSDVCSSDLLRALGAKAGVDVVKLAGGGRHRHGGGHPLREAVVIGRRAERARPVRFGEMIAGAKIDEVKVGGVGQYPPAQPSEREDDQFNVRDAAEIGRAWGWERVCQYV